MADNVLIVFSRPVDGREDEFNEWYESTHVPQVLSVPGVVAARRITLASSPESAGPGKAPNPYAVIYEIEGDPEEVSAEMNKRAMAGEITMTDAFDSSDFALTWWNQISQA